MPEYEIYDTSYEIADENIFNNIESAIGYALKWLPSGDFVYMIGSDSVIVCMVFQGSVYSLKNTGE